MNGVSEYGGSCVSLKCALCWYYQSKSVCVFHSVKLMPQERGLSYEMDEEVCQNI